MKSRALTNRPTYFPLLDLFRALAAFLVVLEHARNYLWIDFPEIVHPSVLIKALYFLSQFGHQAVMLFFVLSGCVVGRITLDSWSSASPWSWPRYLFARLSRLWVVLIPAVLLTWGLDSISEAIARPGSFVFAGGFAHMQAQPLAERHGLGAFLGNLTFLQTIFVPTFGSNSPLWSLANEFWYYIIFPLIWLGGMNHSARRPFYLLTGFALLIFIGAKLALAFPVWLMGAGAYFFGSRWNPERAKAMNGFILGAGITICALSASRLGWLHSDYEPFLLAAPFSIAVMCALHLKLTPRLSAISAFFSHFSYSLYLVHVPILTLLVAPMIRNNTERYSPNGEGLLLLGAFMLIVYTGAWLFYRLTERHTSAIRVALQQWKVLCPSRLNVPPLRISQD